MPPLCDHTECSALASCLHHGTPSPCGLIDRYALATDGAQHLVPTQLWGYTWHERESVDVVVVLLLGLGAPIMLLSWCLMRALAWVCRRFQQPTGKMRTE
jgi:hypothetical protein